jgi:hypothetical protein
MPKRVLQERKREKVHACLSASELTSLHEILNHPDVVEEFRNCDGVHSGEKVLSGPNINVSTALQWMASPLGFLHTIQLRKSQVQEIAKLNEEIVRLKNQVNTGTDQHPLGTTAVNNEPVLVPLELDAGPETLRTLGMSSSCHECNPCT